jgi:hypothetical protein
MKAETGDAERAPWIANLYEVAALEPTFVVAGHRKVDNNNDPRIIGESSRVCATSPGLLPRRPWGGYWPPRSWRSWGDPFREQLSHNVAATARRDCLVNRTNVGLIQIASPATPGAATEKPGEGIRPPPVRPAPAARY